MPSKAQKAFKANAADVDRLLEIHQDIGGGTPGRRYGLEVLNKSAVVLITAIWEAYCEDLATEALEHVVNKSRDATTLPKELKKRIASELKKDLNELAMWDLADAGWKASLRSRLVALTDERNKRLNTPKTENIDELFATALGLPEVSTAWRWKGMTVDTARTKLDRFVVLRGSIAHRGKGAKAVRRAEVEDFFDHAQRLVAKTGGRVNTFVKGVTGSSLW